jgi:Ca-activated chloride channel family protein
LLPTDGVQAAEGRPDDQGVPGFVIRTTACRQRRGLPMTFQAPIWLLGLIAVVLLVVVYVVLQLRRKAYAARFTNVALLGSLVPKRPGWRRHVAFGLLAAALAVLVASLAKPSTEVRVPRERATVVMAVDVSLSMQATDVQPTRFQAMQTAAKEFVNILPARINLGLVSFAGTATTLVPPTTDRLQVRTSLDHLDLAESTAIGEAVFTSLTAIENYQASIDVPSDELPPARIVLLSDGTNTVGRDETQAIDAAKKAGVPVSTIAFGTDYGSLDIDGETVPVPVDRAALEQIADETGGSYSEAASAAELEDVYADIGSQIGYTTEPQDISPWFVRAGVLLALLGVGLSLFFTNRLL